MANITNTISVELCNKTCMNNERIIEALTQNNRKVNLGQ